jgi:hypothetical protein
MSRAERIDLILVVLAIVAGWAFIVINILMEIYW